MDMEGTSRSGTAGAVVVSPDGVAICSSVSIGIKPNASPRSALPVVLAENVLYTVVKLKPFETAVLLSIYPNGFAASSVVEVLANGALIVLAIIVFAVFSSG